MSNPAFKHASRPSYELPNLMKAIGDVDGGEPLDDGMRNAVGAASSHANNAKETLLMGIETIGNLMMQLSQISEAVDDRDLIGIGGIIRHMAVEVQYLIDVEDEMDGILKRDREASKKGAAK
ncbi:hypothetical protein [Massilia sp. DWR3-1-1]|uniref:hypothetical protein n=1 Tax=Massilia sp. DWR3-1-1 TaxID=2804559 RepID=UPI003CEFC42B